MWRFIQGIPKGFRVNLNGSVRQGAPQSACKDEEKDVCLSEPKTLSLQLKKTEISQLGLSPPEGKVAQYKKEWHDWKKANFHKQYWRHQCQNCRFFEAVGWSSALLLGCQLSQLWKYRQAREERRKWAEYHLSQSSHGLTLGEPLSVVSFTGDSSSASRTAVQSALDTYDVTGTRAPGDAYSNDDESSSKVVITEEPTCRPKTPVAWAASEFPSIWGKPLIIDSKWIRQQPEQKYANDSTPETDSSQVDTKADADDSIEFDLETLCNSIKYNQEGNKFAKKGDFDMAILCWKKASRSGSVKADFNLGLCYELGCGVSANKEKAVEFYTKAVSGGSAIAAYNLALLYLNDTDSEEQTQKAKVLMTQASQQGMAEAQVDLGVLYTESGDMKRAAYWFSQASYQKDSAAEYYLGLCYENGWGVDENLCKAADLYSRASKQSHSSAQFRLGTFFENGLGGLQVDKVAALDLYKKSCKGEHSDAASNVARLEQELDTSSDLSSISESHSHMVKVSQSMPALSSFLKNHISSLGKLEWEWFPVESKIPHKASTITDFRAMDETDFRSDSTENGLDFTRIDESSDRSRDSHISFTLGEDQSLSGQKSKNQDAFLSLSGQFGDLPSLTKMESPVGLRRSSTFDSSSDAFSDTKSDESDLSIVFDDNFEGFRLVPNIKAQGKAEETGEQSNSGMWNMADSAYSDMDSFGSAWSLHDGDPEIAHERHLACV